MRRGFSLDSGDGNELSGKEEKTRKQEGIFKKRKRTVLLFWITVTTFLMWSCRL